MFEKLRSGGLEGLLDRDVDVEVFYVQCDRPIAIFERDFG